MIIGDRLKTLREAKNLSQGDIEERTGLRCCYTSRVENGHTVPSVETLEKYARALEIPMYHLMFDGNDPPVPAKLTNNGTKDVWEDSRAGVRLMKKIIRLLSKMKQSDGNLILFLAGRVAKKRA
jgi:transcriptional regulator with XRE-family HTH domain